MDDGRSVLLRVVDWRLSCGDAAAAMAVSRSMDFTSCGLMVTGANVVSVPLASRRAGVTVRSCPAALFFSCSSLVQPVSEVQYETNCSWSTGGGGGRVGGAFRMGGEDCARQAAMLAGP